MKRKAAGKCRRQNNGSAISREAISNGKIPASNPINLPDFDFSKRSHQAAFWMLLNGVVFDRSKKSADALSGTDL